MKPFYIHHKEDEKGSTGGQLSRGFDLNYGRDEMTSGGQREHRVEVLEQNLKNMGLNPDDFSFEDGGRVGYFGGARVLGKMGYQALRKYGIEAKDISRLFASLGTDKSLVGKEKTEYFRNLHKVLRNPDDYPDGIREIQIQLGIDIPGLKSGGLAGILEV